MNEIKYELANNLSSGQATEKCITLNLSFKKQINFTKT